MENLSFKLNKKYTDKIKKMNNSKMLEKINNLEDILKRNAIRYELSGIKILNSLSYNIIAKATSKKYGNVIIKIIMDESLDYSEITMLKLYNGNYACKLLEENKNDNLYILEELIPGKKLATVKNLENRVKILCNLIDNLIVIYNNSSNLHISTYEEILNKAFSFGNNFSLFNGHIAYAKKIYASLKEEQLQLFYLHNDLHHYNVLKSGNEYKAIDPHGVIGEKVFEYVPFIINEYWQNDFDYTHMLKVIQKIVNHSKEKKTNIIKATYIHLLLSTIWFKEDNAREKLINKNIEGLNYLKEVL